MNSYLFIFIWLAFMLLFVNQNGMTQIETVSGVQVRRYKLWFSILIFTPVFLLASIGQPRSDTVMYLKIFDSLPDSWSGLIDEISNMESGQGFTVFGVIVKMIFGESRFAYRIILGLIHSIPLMVVYRKYSDDYILSIFLFVASACHLAWMMNGLRQFVAVVIIFAATPLLLKKKNIQLIALILLASTFHLSAIIMIPIVFIVQGAAWNKKTILYMIIAGMAMYVFAMNWELLDSLLVGTEYEGTVSSWRVLGDDGVNPVRVLVNAVPMVLAFVGRKTIAEEENPMIHIAVNMSIITVGLYLIAMVTSGVTVGRIPIYTGLYSFILLPYLVRKLFTGSSSKLVSLVMIVFYFLYYLYEV